MSLSIELRGELSARVLELSAATGLAPERVLAMAAASALGLQEEVAVAGCAPAAGRKESPG